MSHGLLVLPFFLWIFGAAPVPSGQGVAPATQQVISATSATGTADPNRLDNKLGEGPVDFRCDTLFIYTKPNRNVCRKNVVIRRGDLLVCCEEFEGRADEAWVWQSFTCLKNVRAQRGIETVWADKAEFFQAENDLVLTGRPVLHRGDSILEGERVIIDVKEDHARIFKPRGHMGAEPGALPHKPPAIPQGPLPSVCPIPTLKR